MSASPAPIPPTFPPNEFTSRALEPERDPWLSWLALPPGPSPRNSWKGTLPSLGARLGPDLRRAEVLYLGTPERLRSAARRAWARRSLGVPRAERLRPLARIARSARRAMPELLRDPSIRPVVLGVMCVSPRVAARLLSKARPARRKVLVLDGVDLTDPDVAWAVDGVRALCDRAGAELRCFE